MQIIQINLENTGLKFCFNIIKPMSHISHFPSGTLPHHPANIPSVISRQPVLILKKGRE